MRTTTGFIRQIDTQLTTFFNFNEYHHTFGRHSTVYNAPTDTYTDFELVELSTKEKERAIEPTDLNKLFDIIQHILTLNDNGTITADVDAFNGEMMAFLAATPNYTVVADKINEEVLDETSVFFPNYITVTINSVDDPTIVTSSCVLWFSTLNFETEHNLISYDIVVIPPVENIDDLALSIHEVKQLMSDRGPRYVIDALNEATKEKPYTATNYLDTRWNNKDIPIDQLDIPFHFICYGSVSDDSRVLIQAIKEYILGTTQLPVSIWEIILPEIFSATSYIMIPFWSNVSQDTPTAYNPISNINKISNFIKDSLTGLNGSYVDETLEYFPTMWQSLPLATIGNLGNPNGTHKLSSTLQDYLLVAPNSAEFIRLSSNTRDLILSLHNYLPIARDYNADTVLPEGLEREYIDGFLFLVFRSYSITCKVLVKAHFDEFIGV